MLLRKLSIFGFKSFADKTELRFGEGMTAVIGPNGCGKSNVVDAIRWVFGEQKASALRSNNMQDVIFSGTEKRSPLNFAEVTLTISNEKGILPIEYSEVAITRRIFRSGESEYLINRAVSRLKDIHGLFIDTGVGTSAYTTIENSMINRILSDKAEERRMLFEEAAGIGKFKQRIRESQRKLDRTKQDLLRINDRVQEKERYVRMLGRQVEKAKRYKQYHEDLKSLEVGFENARYQTLKESSINRAVSMQKLDDTIAMLQAKIATAESKIENLNFDKIEKESAVQIASQNVGNVGKELNTLDRELSVSRQSLAMIHENLVRYDQEIESFEEQGKEKQELLTNIENSIIDRESQLAEHSIRVDGAKNELGAFDSRVSGEREKLDELTQRQFQLVQQASECQQERSNSQTNQSNCVERCERSESEITRMEEQAKEYRIALNESRQKLEDTNDSLKHHLNARKELWTRIEHEDSRYHELIEKEKQLEAKIDASKSKLHFLEGMNASFEGYDAGVKALLKKKMNGSMGIIADLIEVADTKLVKLVERVLGVAIQTIVFRTDADLKAAVYFLENEKVGSARMISLETLLKVSKSDKIDTFENTLSMRLSVSTTEECSLLADHLFNATLVCDNVANGFSLQEKLISGTRIVSRDGMLFYSDGTVVAGTQKKEVVGILQRKQEIEKLTIDIEKFNNKHNLVVHKKEICIITRDEAKHALVGIDDKLNSNRQKQQKQETNIRHYEAEIQNVCDRIEYLIPELTENRANIDIFKAKIIRAQTLLDEICATRQDIEGQVSSTRERLAEMEVERDELADHLRNIEIAKHGLVNRLDQDKRSIIQLRRDIDQSGQNRQRKLEDKNRSDADIKNFDEKLITLQESINRQVELRNELSKTLDIVREEYNETLAMIDEIRKLSKANQDELNNITTKRNNFEVQQTRDEEQLRSIREKIYTAYEIDLKSPECELPTLSIEDIDITENINMLKERLRRVGEVNMGAIHEYEKENGELQELIKQRDDLQNAVNDLERAIKKLNKEARVQFVQTFESVQGYFREMFTTLFEGGEAMLELEPDIDPLDAPIRINVRPAGKKMRGVTLLSGGERALTAISLLFALYLVKPSAYCILDELDAPLDDANVGRFIRVLKKFSQKTQFIIITHNKHTMEAADLLYGVTQQEKGVSSVASLLMGENFKLLAA